jgi:hypothetical protein
MGIDYGGDGSWDWVNTTNYDRDLDGIPDTGMMKTGQTFDILVVVEIPPGAPSGTEYVNVTVTNKNGKASDSASNTCVIPEFYHYVLAMLGMSIIVMFFYYRRRKVKPKEDVPLRRDKGVRSGHGRP